MKVTSMQSAEDRAYKAPTLIVHGDVATLTAGGAGSQTENGNVKPGTQTSKSPPRG
jgi:hypothetical protein